MDEIIIDSDSESGEDFGAVETPKIINCFSLNPNSDNEMNEVEILEIKPLEERPKPGLSSLPEGPEENYSEDSKDDDDSEFGVITIDDDDEKNDNRKVPKNRTCHRCIDKNIIRNPKKFWIHVDRHILPETFVCPTCQLTFIQLNYCLSHEFRVHGTPIPPGMRDQVTAVATSHELKKKLKTKETENESDGNVTDNGDVKFYENRFSCSSTLLPYKGPGVKTVLECYEIQNHLAPPKSKGINAIAKKSITNHKENFRSGYDEYRLGRFSKRKRDGLLTASKEKAKSKKK